ncbi:MAG TPA: hypothetical protein VFZ78_01065 [Flavisolibacter sp.]
MKRILLPVALLAFLVLPGCKKTDIIDDLFGANALHNRSVGASANELLSDSKYTSLKVQIQYMTGYAPDPAAVSHLQNFLSAYLNKPAGISVVTSEISPAAAATLTVNDIVNIENQNRSAFTSSGEIALYILYTNGQYSSASTLGVAYRNTSAALFGKTIRDNSGGIGQVSRTKLEATVLEHEVSHLLGLVDIGSPMQVPHKDAAHGNHCTNSSCLMYYTAETTDILGLLLTGNIPALDVNCINDLKANGGK